MKHTSPTQRSGVRQSAVLAWLRLARVFQKIDILSERFFRTQDLNTAQFDVLAQVGSTNEMTQQELASALLVTKGNVSQLLSKMEQDHLVIRRQEGRTNYLSKDVGVWLKWKIDPLSVDEQRELLRLLRKLDQGITT